MCGTAMSSNTTSTSESTCSVAYTKSYSGAMVRVVIYTNENNMVKMMAAMRRTIFMGVGFIGKVVLRRHADGIHLYRFFGKPCRSYTPHFYTHYPPSAP